MAAHILVCLHGWGGSKESFTELREALQGTDIEIVTPDLPGFGAEPEPGTPWTNDDYAHWMEQWINNNAQRSPNTRLFLLGHSHGGRIAVKIALRHNIPIDHLFLCAPAGIYHARHLKRTIGLVLAKTGKFFTSIPGLRALAPIGRKALYKLIRVHDYERASPLMQQTLINVTREDFRELLKDIDIPTDIFWGTDDRMTPIGDATIFATAIAKSTLHVYPGVRHRVHREKAPEIAAVILARFAR
jgi:pimeloyl-ACP methyl ester carboxylesterase